MTRLGRGYLMGAAAIALAAPMPLCAQQADAASQTQKEVYDPLSVDQIVVTARRRQERLRDVPISATAFQEAYLEQLTIRSVADVIDYAPNVSATSGGSGGDDANFFIRGIGQIDDGIAVDPGVGIYVDEVYLGRLQGAAFQLLDIERIEVLRGPQGTLFGRNTIGGAINIVTQSPEFGAYSAEATLTAGNLGLVQGRGNVNLPIGEKAALRISGLAKTQDGWVDDGLRDISWGAEDVQGGRARFRWEPRDDLRIDLAADIINRNANPFANVITGFDQNAGRAFATPRPGGPPVPPPWLAQVPFFVASGVPFPGNFADFGGDQDTAFLSVPPTDDTDTMGASGTVTWDVSDNVTLKSITAFRSLEEFVWRDFDGTPFAFYDASTELDQEQFSQELQLFGTAFEERLDWLVGAYYFEEDAVNDINLCLGSRPVIGDLSCVRSLNTVDLEIQSAALFSHLEYALNEKFSVFGGLRYNYEEKVQTVSSVLSNLEGVPTIFPVIPGFYPPAPPGTSIVEQAPTTFSDDWAELIPKVGVNYRPTPKTLIYASYAEGFKSGGFTSRPVEGGVRSFDPETVETYEIGLKSAFAGGRALVSAAAFTSDYEALQLLVTDGFGAFDTRNAGDVEIQGFELELFTRPARGWELSAGIGYTDAEYTSIGENLPPGLFIPGLTLDDDLPVTPEFTGAVSALYTHQLARGGALVFAGDYNYRSEVSFQIENDPLEIEEGYGLLNGRVTYRFPSERVELSVFGLNILDEEFNVNRADNLSANGVATRTPGQPARWGFDITVRM